MTDPFDVFDDLPDTSVPARQQEPLTLGIPEATLKALRLRQLDSSQFWPNIRPSKQGLLFSHGRGHLLATGPGEYLCGKQKNAYNVFPGLRAGTVDLYLCPIEAAQAWHEDAPEVAWIRGADGWRGQRRKPLESMIEHLSGKRVRVHCDGRLNDPKQWQALKSLHKTLTATCVAVVVVDGGTAVTQPFATRPKSAQEKMRERFASQVQTPAKEMPDAVLIARGLAADPFRRGYFGSAGRIELAALAADVVRCFDGRVRRGPEGLWVHGNGLWMPAGDLVSMVVAALLKEHWTQNLEDRVLGYLQRLPEFASLRNHPEDDGWQHLVNFTNGLYDWRTGELRAHDPNVLSTWQLTVPYEPGPAPMWEEFLSEVLPPDMLVKGPNGVAPWQEDFGYLLVPGNPLHRSFLLRGPGRNGKGVWMAVLRQIAGRFSALTLEDLSDPSRSRFRLVDLYGSPVNIAGEIDPGFLKNTAVFKQMTGGDEMTFEPKFKSTFKARVWAVPIFSANEDFRAKDNSVAFWDRWEVRLFPNVIEEGKRDPSLARRIFGAEGPQIAALAMDGSRALMQRGSFSRQPSSESAKDQFRRTSDHITRFLEERVTFTDSQKDRITRDALTNAYHQWCEDEQERPRRSSDLYAALTTAAAQRGIPDIATKSSGTRGFSHITLEDTDRG